MHPRIAEHQGRCRSCGTDAYSINELNLHEDQAGRCYRCFDQARYPGFAAVAHHSKEPTMSSDKIEGLITAARRALNGLSQIEETRLRDEFALVFTPSDTAGDAEVVARQFRQRFGDYDFDWESVVIAIRETVPHLSANAVKEVIANQPIDLAPREAHDLAEALAALRTGSSAPAMTDQTQAPEPDADMVEAVARALMLHHGIDPDVFIGMNSGLGHWAEAARSAIAALRSTGSAE